jgi:hypothetical protein
MPDYDLDDLLAALNSVAAESDPDDDTDHDANDDLVNDDSRDPNDNDDRDDSWDREQGEDNEQDDGTDEDDGDYASRRSVMLLEKLNSEARWTLDRSVAQRIAHSKQPAQPISKTDQNMSSIAGLREKTSQINFEMETGKLLAVETKKYQEASLALYLSNLTPEQKREHDEDMRRMQEHYSGICEEVSPDWREQATAAFRNKRLS